jgi:hypothetical protein
VSLRNVISLTLRTSDRTKWLDANRRLERECVLGESEEVMASPYESAGEVAAD